MPGRPLVIASLCAVLLTNACIHQSQKSIDKNAIKSISAERSATLRIVPGSAGQDTIETILLAGFELCIQHSGIPEVRFKNGKRTLYACTFGKSDLVSLLFTDSSSRDKDLIVCIEVKHAENNEFEYIFYRLTKNVQLLDYLKTGYARFRVIELPGGGKALEGEDILQPWGANTVAPTLTLSWDGHNIAALRRNKLSEKLLKAKAAEILQAFHDVDTNTKGTINLAPPELAEESLNVVYNGEQQQARRLFDLSWPRERRGKESYWNFVISSAKQSRSWHYVQRINHAVETPHKSALTRPKHASTSK